MISIKSVSKSFNKRLILSNVSLELEAGKTHVFLGESGSGKSTLLRMIMGLIQPDQGEILINSQRMGPETQRALAKDIGYVLQEGGLFPHLSTWDNVCLVARANSWSSAQIMDRMRELCEVVSLDFATLQRFPNQLSGGQRQRAAIMRAIFLDPSCLLLDEPLGALDPIIRSRLQNELRDIFIKLKKLVVMVTHDLSEAAFFGDTVTLIHQGEILQYGLFKDLLEFPKHAYVTEFVQAQSVFHGLRVKE